MTVDPEGTLDELMAAMAAGQPARVVASREEYDAANCWLISAGEMSNVTITDCHFT